jgi:hypothetical protein
MSEKFVYPDEEWRDVDDYLGCYKVSNYGRIKSLSRIITKSNGQIMNVDEKILSQREVENGYLVEIGRAHV